MEVEIKIDSWDSSKQKHQLGVSHNGYQWVTFSELTKEELKQIEDACHKYISKLESKTEASGLS